MRPRSVLGALAPSPALVLVGIALAGRTTSDSHGAATGTVITIAYLGFVLGPAAVGRLSGASTLPTALLGVALVAALLLVSSPVLARIAAE